MTTRIHGTFEVDMSPLALHEQVQDTMLGRRSIDKQFHGELEATSVGEMLSAGTAVEGSAGYVAIETVTGTLQGRSGSFVLLHRGIMTRGNPELTIMVVPDSGTGELEGLSGEMTINFVEGQHAYEFEYSLV